MEFKEFSLFVILFFVITIPSLSLVSAEDNPQGSLTIITGTSATNTSLQTSVNPISILILIIIIQVIILIVLLLRRRKFRGG